ncbi:MAG: AsmA family protein, partial [Alphaproteobacteria bacterium]
MKKLLIAVAVVVLIVVAAAVVVPQFVPLETVKAEIASQVRAASGRELTIGGDIRLSVLPAIELEVEDVAFSNAPGASEAQMATLSELRLKLAFWPLLSGAVEVDSFVLVDPVVHLEVDAKGRPNWAFEAAAEGDAAPATEEAATPAEGEAGPAVTGLKLGDVRIVNGVLAYRDATGAEYRVSDINMKVELPAFDSPFKAEGSLVFNDEKLTIEAEVTTPARLVAGERAEIEVEVTGAPLTLEYEGGVVTAAPFRADGAVGLEVPSLRALAAWAGEPLAFEGSGLGPFRIKGRLAAKGQAYAFSQAEIALDDIKAKGGVAVDLGGGKPYVEGRLDVERLDLNPYLPPEPEAAAGATDSTGAGAGGDAAAQPGDWSDEPIDLSPLRLANADLAFSAGSLAIRKIEIGRSALAVRLKDGELVIELEEMALYGGGGAARVRIDARRKVPVIEKSVRFSGVQAEPLLSAAADFDRLTGTTEAEIAISTKGRSQREMVANLGGNGAVKFVDGAIKGVNLGAMVRNVRSAFLDAEAGVPQQTDFAELSGTFRIASGILRNDDLALLAPLLRVGGKGSLDLPRRTVNYRIEPKLAATGQGQGGATDVAGLMVPVIVEGPWHDLDYRPDLAGLVEQTVKDPEGALGAVKGVAEGAKGLVEGLLGSPSGSEGEGGGDGTTEEPAAPDPLKTLKNLFGGG